MAKSLYNITEKKEYSINMQAPSNKVTNILCSYLLLREIFTFLFGMLCYKQYIVTKNLCVIGF